MNFSEIMQLKILDSYNFMRTNFSIRDQFPSLPIYSNSEIPPLKKIKTNKKRIKDIIDKFCNEINR